MTPLLAAAGASSGDTISIEFADGRIGAKVTEGTTGTRPVPKPAPPRKKGGGEGGQEEQGEDA